jgi:DNA-binding CsgD family transcriptional regulator
MTENVFDVWAELFSFRCSEMCRSGRVELSTPGPVCEVGMAIVERERQLGELTELYETAASGRGRVVLVDGGVASGKTQLVNAVARHAAGAGALVLTATGSRAESTVRLGVVGQLHHSARSQGVVLSGMPDTGTEPAEPAGEDSPTLGHGEARLLGRVCQALLTAADRPLVLVVDDVQFADPLSHQALLYLQRRIHAMPVLLVLSGCVAAMTPGSAFRAELTRQPHCRELRLLPLTREGVARLLAGRLSAATAARLVAPVHALSGGSPVLADALADDYLAGPAEPEEPVVGEAFLRAALTCLHRSDPRLLDVARALAILGPAAGADTIAALAGLTPATAEHALGAHGRTYAHPAVRAAVLEDCPPGTRSRAARFLYDRAAPATEIAAQLVAGGRPADPWAVPVLVAAADESGAGLEYLELAMASARTRRQRAVVEAALVRELWHRAPGRVARHLPSLLEAARSGLLAAGDAMLLARSLAWHGRVAEAADVLARQADLTGHPDPDLAADHRATRDWLRHCHPEWADPVLSTADDAVRVLQCAAVSEPLPVGAWQALRALVDAGALDRASGWCERLHTAAEARGAVTWQAVLSDVRAAIALRRGELVAAARHARAALAAMPAPAWGIAIGSPLTHLVLAGTMSGAGADDAVGRSTPAALRASLFWPHYLRSRGLHHAATDRQHAALVDLRTAGELALRWGADDTAALPWRVDLARVHVHFGQSEDARELLVEHLALSTGRRARGAALRVLAPLCPPNQRQAMLREAVELLAACGDRYELAHALGEAGGAMMGRRALRLAEECGAEPLRRKLAVVYDEPDGTEAAGLDALSEAERRVVNLAALGHTNREIGQKLFITVSTVEQHLTRAYRKLNISGRADLVS